MKNKIKIRLRLVIIKEDKLLSYYNSIDDCCFYIGGKLEFGEAIKDGWKREIKTGYCLHRQISPRFGAIPTFKCE